MSAETISLQHPARPARPARTSIPAGSPATAGDAPLLGGPADDLVAAPWTLVVRGAPLQVRAARVGDLPGLAGLLVRSSPTTRLGWSGRGGTVLPLAQQEAWLREPGSVVVEAAPGRLVAVGALRPATCTGADDPIAAAAELLVHDAWQRRGLGGALLRHFAAAALLAGRSELQVHPEADPVAAQALLSSTAAALGARARGQRHAHGRCPRVHVPRGALAHLGALRG